VKFYDSYQHLEENILLYFKAEGTFVPGRWKQHIVPKLCYSSTEFGDAGIPCCRNLKRTYFSMSFCIISLVSLLQKIKAGL
jgi:hypothetical protein